MMNGIDISDYQRGIDLNAVPFDFMICKVTEGTTIVHTTHTSFIQMANKLGKKWGFYHFLNTEDVIKQADFFVSQAKEYFGHGIPFLDYEMYGKVHGAAGAWQFVQRVHELTGVWCGFYTNRATLSEDDFSAVASKCPLWVAQYANNEQTGYQSEPWLPDGGFGAWTNIIIHQYSSNGRLDGYSSALDLDLAYIDANAWNNYAQLDSNNTSSNSNTSSETTASSEYENYDTLELVAMVQEGKLGDGEDRVRNLGSKYQAVQDVINHIYSSSSAELADDTVRGAYGNGDLRKRVLGGRYDEVQSIINQRAGIGTQVVYVVQSGDTLSGIASRYSTTAKNLAQYNGIANMNLIYPGQKIIIP